MILRRLTKLRPRAKSMILLASDGLALLAGAAGALVLRGDGALQALGPVLLFGAPLVLGATVALRLHRVRLLDYRDNGLPASAAVAGVLGLGLLVLSASAIGPAPDSALLIGLMFLLGSAGLRLALLQVLILVYRHARMVRRVLIYGSGDRGRSLARLLRGERQWRSMGYVDDDPARHGMLLGGLRIHPAADLPALVAALDIDLVLLALPAADRARVAGRLAGLPCQVQALPGLAEQGPGPAEDQALADLLGRPRLEDDLPRADASYHDTAVLITGAGGSIGAELCRQIAAFGPSRLVLLDHSEQALFTIAEEMRRLFPALPLEPVLGSICDAALVRDLMRGSRIRVVLHAAAYKHLSMVEDNPLPGIANNVLGTRVLAEAAEACGVERFILVSSDKAVRPSCVMGRTKRLAEEIMQDHAARDGACRFAMVRFGNVLGSSGSVVPLFRAQIVRGGPVTVTHPEVTRYFMTVTEAVRLLLLAGSFAKGGEVFVLDMGQPVPILRLARQMIAAAGLRPRDEANPDGDIEIRFTGLRPGEKLHEELLIGEARLPTPHARILRAREAHLSPLELAAALAELRRAVEARDADGARAILQRWTDRRPVRGTTPDTRARA